MATFDLWGAYFLSRLVRVLEGGFESLSFEEDGWAKFSEFPSKCKLYCEDGEFPARGAFRPSYWGIWCRERDLAEVGLSSSRSVLQTVEFRKETLVQQNQENLHSVVRPWMQPSGARCWISANRIGQV